MAIASGTLTAQAITAASAPILSRIFTPAEIGNYTVIIALAGILGAVASLRWELAIPVAGDGELQSVAYLGILSAICTTAAGSLLLILCSDRLIKWFDLAELMPWLLLAPAIAGAQGCLFVLNQLAIRRRAFGAVGRRTAVRAAAIVSVQVGGGLSGIGLGSLVMGVVAGNALAAAMLLRGSGLLGAATRMSRSRRALRRVAGRHRRSPFLLTPAALINAVSTQLPVLMLAGAFGATVAGWLGMAITVLAMPVALVSQSVGQVLLSELSQARSRSHLAYRRVYWRAALALTSTAVLVAAVLAVFGPSIFSILLGSRWRTSGEYAQLLAATLALQMIAVPLGQALVTSGRQGIQLSWDCFRLAVVPGATGLAIASGQPPSGCILAFGVSSAVAYLTLWGAASWAVTRPLIHAADPFGGPKP